MSIDRLSAFQAIGIDWYLPAPDPRVLNPPLPPMQGEGFPLGDAFRRHHLEQP